MLADIREGPNTHYKEIKPNNMNNIYAQYVVHIRQQRVKFNERCN